jgi:hypothetical protein
VVGRSNRLAPTKISYIVLRTETNRIVGYTILNTQH